MSEKRLKTFDFFFKFAEQKKTVYVISFDMLCFHYLRFRNILQRKQSRKGIDLILMKFSQNVCPEGKLVSL